MSESTSAVLIPWAQTDWQVAGRYASATPIALNAHGEQQIEAWAVFLKKHKLCGIHGPETGPGEQTTTRLAALLGAKARKTALFAEVGLGLWEGLPPEELKKRFGRSYKQWRDDPSSVCPPEGERLSHAIERLVAEIKKLARKRVGECFGVVLGPLAFAGIRCHLEGNPYSGLWEVPFDQPVKYFIDLEEDTATLTFQSGLAN